MKKPQPIAEFSISWGVNQMWIQFHWISEDARSMLFQKLKPYGKIEEFLPENEISLFVSPLYNKQDVYDYLKEGGVEV